MWENKVSPTIRDVSQITDEDNVKHRLDLALETAESIITKNYFAQLENLAIAEPTFDETDIDVAKDGCFYKLSKLALNKDENFLSKLITIVNVAASVNGSIATLIKSNGKIVEYYFGIVLKHTENNDKRKAAYSSFGGAIHGNLIGSDIELLGSADAKSLCDGVFSAGSSAVSSISGIVSLRIKDEKAPNEFVQGIENLTDSLRNNPYTILLIADPVSSDKILQIKHGYEIMYTQLATFKKLTATYNETQALSLSTAQSVGVSSGLTTGIALSQSKSFSKGRNFGTFNSNSISLNAGISIAPGGIGGSLGAGKANQSGTSEQTSFGEANQAGQTFSTASFNQINTNKTDSETSSDSKGKSLQIEYENRSVNSMLEKIDKHLERLDACESFGAFECAAYVIAETRGIAQSVASNYNALMRGESSFVQSSQVNTWSRSDETKRLIEYLSSFSHPNFELPIGENQSQYVTPASIISGQEIAIQMGLPKKSVAGIPVVEMAAFGRNITNNTDESHISLGGLWHMGSPDGSASVDLNKQSLTKHTFITGSTGSGKSNTIYKLLDSLCPEAGAVDKEDKVNFLVIEPAKGEYKDVFGWRGDVTVYGTNPFKFPNLLQVNPFSFPDDVHVLEHVDRLVEVFNACWPMYAAMPAILKEAVEKSYEEVGWNLRLSKNPGAYPTFKTLLEILPKVVDSSAYSSDTSSDYKGALVTRVRSLTRGLLGLVFSGDISSGVLFNENAIVDISRVGSQETKALIMGMLVLKLQEFRMSEEKHNSKLQHITVLEEAHNLLRRTSSEQAQESSNLQGKSVEMIASAIAEMRSYGEGFVIADQSPGLMDMSVIRNTNTKIIMRLPDESDRILVGKAAGLNDSQVAEIARFKVGVAAISQSDWLEPVLCKVDVFENRQSLNGKKAEPALWKDKDTEAIKIFFNAAFDIEREKLTIDVIERVQKWSLELELSESAKNIFENVLESRQINGEQKMILVLYIIGEKLRRIAVREDAIAEVKKTLYGKYDMPYDDEVMRRVSELFLIHFPS